MDGAASAIKEHACNRGVNVLAVPQVGLDALKDVDRPKAVGTQCEARTLRAMELTFAKWQGTGNDFVLIDDRQGLFPGHDLALVRRLCDRHFGIGSDGLVLVQRPTAAGMDFHMEFHNPDGSRSFCGNGSRCAFAFWSGLEGGAHHGRFTAIDGPHEGRWVDGAVSISLPDMPPVRTGIDGPHVDHLDTGSPHELVWVDDVDAVDILQEAPPRRHARRHAPGGSNVNFLSVLDGALHMRTFERGVEAETLSCGSGVVAAALGALQHGRVKAPVMVMTRGGRLDVEARALPQGGFGSVRLIGPAKAVFTGSITI
jgi:diaminopimelate epimerase